MRVWDIIDTVEPGIQITETLPSASRWRGIASSAVKATLAISLTFASSCNFTIRQIGDAAIDRANVRLVNPGDGIQTSARPQQRHVITLSDTQAGQSTVKLSKAFSAYFEQAPDEESYEDDYSFS